MSAVDVEIDLETLWGADHFTVFLTPLRAGQVVYPEKQATMTVHQGRSVVHATWTVAGPTMIDGAKARVGERVAILDCEPTQADPNHQLVIVVGVSELP